MINSDELKSTGILTEGKYLKSNNYLKWFNYFGISDPCFKFWSLRGDLKSFSETIELYDGKKIDSGITNYLFNEDGQFIKQVGEQKEGRRTEISYSNFQSSNHNSVTVENFDNNGEKYGIEIRDFSFAKLVRFRTEYQKQGRKQDIKIKGIRVTQLRRNCFLIEDDKNSEKEKIFVDEEGSFTKKIRFYNTKYDESKTIVKYTKNNRKSELEIEFYNKDDKTKYSEKQTFNFDLRNRLTTTNVTFNNEDGDRFYNNVYKYEDDKLISFHQEYDWGHIRKNLFFDYDVRNNLIQIKGDEFLDEFNYQYDEFGNWLKLERNYSNRYNQFKHILKRNYEYKK